MILSFKKTIDEEISVELKGTEGYEEFSYTKMIQKMHEDKSVEEAEIVGDFSQIERDSINQLISELRDAATEADSTEEEKLPF